NPLIYCSLRNICSSPVLKCLPSESLEQKENVDKSKDRTEIIPVETSIRYLKSSSYNITYGSNPVWLPYRRNHKGLFPPHKTRKTCIRAGKISTGNPCPICRDEYLILHHQNIELLKQFISEHTGKMDSSNLKCHSEITLNTMDQDPGNNQSASLNQNNQEYECVFLIIGGGIAGISCAETIKLLAPHEKIIVISESDLVKSTFNIVHLGKYIQCFDIQEVDSKTFANNNLQIITDKLKKVVSKENVVETVDGIRVKYQFLCICTGAQPKLFQDNTANDNIFGIRDTESVQTFQNRIKKGKKFVLVGNGGIASEIAHEIRNIDIDWVIKDHHIASKFVDKGAAKFFNEHLMHNRNNEKTTTIIKRLTYEEDILTSHKKAGAALGPDWHKTIDLPENFQNNQKLKVFYGSEIKAVTKNSPADDYLITVELDNGKKLKTDFIVSATGVTPLVNFQFDTCIKTNSDGAIIVDEFMKTTIENIFAAGDVCEAGWTHSFLWHQMNLWTQAKQMGTMAGKSMVAAYKKEEIYPDFCFEMFTHVTKLFGFQVVLLGKFNGQGLNDGYDLLFRVTPDKEYIKFVLHKGRLVGAILIGETGLEETCENLILNQIDLTEFGDDILNPNIDIDDYFD
ncbi:CLUMA_CG000226, isoform A, partial [Clunio marinus]